MKYISIFSGIEAASVAWESLGWEAMAFAEIDPFPCAVLAERYPSVPNLGSVVDVDWSKFVKEHGRPDVVVGGSPCQSFSIAGDRTGLKGESGLMFEYIRAVRELRPRWFVWENVPGALTSEHGEAFRQLLSEMDALGYGLAWRILDAQFFGVPQRRERIFLVGRFGTCPPVEVLFEREGVPWNYQSSRKKREELTARISGSVDATSGRGAILMTDTQSHTTLEHESSGPLTAHSRKDPPVVTFTQGCEMNKSTYVCETAHSGSNGLGVGESDVFSTLDTSTPPQCSSVYHSGQRNRPL